MGDADALRRGLDRFRALTGRGHFHAPLYLVLDLELLLEHGFQTPFASDRGFARWTPERRSTRLRYEREFLGRLVQAPDIQRALETLRFARENRSERVELLMARLMESFAPLFPRAAIVNPAHLREFKAPPIENEEQLLAAEASFLEKAGAPPDFFRATLEEFLDNVSRGARWGELLRAEDFFELEHWESLPTEHLRVGCRQLIEAERRLGEADPRQIPISESESEAETAFVDETHYPTGGLAGLTNRGSFENLVLSELLYMDADPDAPLFELRHIEGELLYYMRDEGQLRRKRRVIHFIIDLADAFQAKSRGHDYQFSILIQALFLRVFKDLAKVFERDSVVARFHYIQGGADPEMLEREINVMRALLADLVRHGWVEFRVVQDLDPFQELRDPRRKTYALAASADRAEMWEDAFADLSRDKQPLYGATHPGRSASRGGDFLGDGRVRAAARGDAFRGPRPHEKRDRRVAGGPSDGLGGKPIASQRERL
jgi:hypothetical protein